MHRVGRLCISVTNRWRRGEPRREPLRQSTEEAVMKTKPDFKFGDRVIRIGEGRKRGVVSRVFQSGGVWWLAFEGKPDWRYAPRHFRRVA
jgi:hypothetical protein